MKQQAGYISKTADTRKGKELRKPQKSRAFPKLVVTFLLFSFALAGLVSSGLVGYLASQNQTVSTSSSHSADANMTQWFMCVWGEDTPPSLLYNLSETDRLWFELQSKSYIGNGYDQVDDSFFNGIINFTREGPDFGEINRWVFDAQNEDDSFNLDGSLSPYDRFGVAGLNWSMYGGEWNYLHFDPCEDEDVTELTMGEFYEGRLTPLSTWDDVSTSEDVRTEHFQNGWTYRWWVAFINILANWSFGVAKFVVVFTISIVSIAFSDVLSLLGIDEFMWGGDSANVGDGIMGALYQGVFMPLVVLAFVLTGIYVIYHGIIKRNYRTALLPGLVRPIVCYIIAVVIFSFPSTIVPLPNNIAIALQSIIFSASTVGTAGGEGLCESNIAAFGSGDVIPEDFEPGIDEDESLGLMEQVGVNTSSAIGCMFWQYFLLEPWAQGQFGTSWDQLFVEGNELDPDHGHVEYVNEEWTGDFPVPRGPTEDDFLHNLAIFQISTQTDAHYDQFSEEIAAQNSYYGDVHADWWRLADALSNYDVETVQSDVDAMNLSGEDETIESEEPMNNAVTEEWEDWFGGHVWNRVMTAILAVLAAVVGSFLPLVFAMLAVAYAIGLAILLTFAPVFLLFACWAGRGYEIFKEWLELVLNTMMKRIGIAFLFVFVLIFTMSALDMMSTVGILQGTTVFVIGSWLIFRNRQKFVEMFEFFQFSGSNGMKNVASGMVNKTKSVAGSAALYGGNVAVGGITGARNYDDGTMGGRFAGFGKGMQTGLKESVKHAFYSSRSTIAESGRAEWARSEYAEGRQSSIFDDELETDPLCPICRQPIDGGQGFRDEMGRLYHLECGEMNRGRINFIAEYIPLPSRADIEQERLEKRYGSDWRGAPNRQKNAAVNARTNILRGGENGSNAGINVEDFDGNPVNDENGKQVNVPIAEDKLRRAYSENNEEHYASETERRAYSLAGQQIALESFQETLETFEDIRRHSRYHSEVDQVSPEEGRLKAVNELKTVDVPDEIKDFVDENKLRGMYGNGDWPGIEEEMKGAWIAWYQRNTDPKYETEQEQDAYELTFKLEGLAGQNDLVDELRKNFEKMEKDKRPDNNTTRPW